MCSSLAWRVLRKTYTLRQVTSETVDRVRVNDVMWRTVIRTTDFVNTFTGTEESCNIEEKKDGILFECVNTKFIVLVFV